MQQVWLGLQGSGLSKDFAFHYSTGWGLEEFHGVEMTRISTSHLLASRAVLEVSSVLDRAGALAERIANDYGEDLLVQTQLSGQADPFRLLIQVKGVRSKKGAQKILSIRFDVRHLWRWVSHIEPVLVCVYEDVEKKTYAFVPRHRFSLWELATTNNKTLTVKLSKADIFDAETAGKFIWYCRISYFSDALSLLENRRYYVFDVNKSDELKKKYFNEINTIVFAFLKSIGVIKGDYFDDEFKRFIRNGSRNMSASNADGVKPELDLRAVFMLALLGRCDDACGVGLPRNLMEHGTEMCGTLFRAFHPNEWADAQRQFIGDTWNPYN